MTLKVGDRIRYNADKDTAIIEDIRGTGRHNMFVLSNGDTLIDLDTKVGKPGGVEVIREAKPLPEVVEYKFPEPSVSTEQDDELPDVAEFDMPYGESKIEDPDEVTDAKDVLGPELIDPPEEEADSVLPKVDIEIPIPPVKLPKEGPIKHTGDVEKSHRAPRKNILGPEITDPPIEEEIIEQMNKETNNED